MGARRARLAAAGAAAAVALAVLPAGASVATARTGPSLVPGAREAALAAAARPPADLTRPPRADVATDRYELAGGCYAVRSVERDRYLVNAGEHYLAAATARADAEPFHLQATDLGSYLLVTPELRYLGVPGGLLGDVSETLRDDAVGATVDGLTRGVVAELVAALESGPLGEATGRGAWVNSVPEPSPLTDWVVDEVDGGFTLTLPELGRSLSLHPDDGLGQVPADQVGHRETFAFERTDGCVAWPEIGLGVEGPIATGETGFGEVRGYLDAHLHGMAFEFLGGRARCGRPWSRYGVADALRGCPEHELLGGRTHVLETIMSGRDPVAGHDTTGWPTFAEWPEHFSYTYEQTYHRWLERAWRGGLRMYVNLLVDNNKLCTVYPYNRNSCNEMDGVRLQARQLRAFERYIDAQHGGPGAGWLRIVEDPFEARRVINEGKLAVVMGVEVSLPFDCGIVAGQPQCDTTEIDRELDALHDLGVRQMEIVNKFDNALTGVAGDAGEIGVLTNTANFLETGSFWKLDTCSQDMQDHDASDRTFINLPDEADLPEDLAARDGLVGVILSQTGTSGLAPVYPASPHCNQRGLTDLGEHTIRRMVERGMLFDPDHMSAIGRDQAMTLLEGLGYSGVISSHTWSDDGIYERIHRIGGVVTPMAKGSSGFVQEWLENRGWADDRFLFGFGYGSDIQGFASQGGPRHPAPGEGVTYPFEGLGGVTIDRQVSGERVFDINSDGVAHYGLYPDWIEDLRVQAGDAIVADLARGSEAYLQMWERALGVPGDSCRADLRPLAPATLRQVGRGDAPEEVLLALGQPRSRDGGRFTYCVDGGRTAAVVFGRDERVSRVTVRRGQAPAPVAPAPAEDDDLAATAAAVAAEAAEEEARGHDHAGHPDAGRDHDDGHDHDATVAHGHDPAAVAAGAAVPGGDRTGAIRVALLLLGAAALAVRQLGGDPRPPGTATHRRP